MSRYLDRKDAMKRVKQYAADCDWKARAERAEAERDALKSRVYGLKHLIQSMWIWAGGHECPVCGAEYQCPHDEKCALKAEWRMFASHVDR